MKTVIEFIKQKWFIQLVGIIAICAIIWVAGPLFAFANKKPLSSEHSRMVCILVIVIIWAVYNLIMRASSSSTDQKFMDKMAKSEADQTDIEEKQKAELNTLRLKFENALKKLKQKRSKGGRDKRYLYELPWYIIIGAPGCGKTTLLKNSGLHFPLLDDNDAEESSVKGVGGTRNCDWLFTDEAIFLDTAGRYTTHDSYKPVDEVAWKGFLKLIKEYRSRRPINGILVTASVYNLLQMTEKQRHKHAGDIQKRIHEIHEELGIQFPIYMLFTKCDLVAGFKEFFSDLDPHDRKQVWGRTFQDYNADKTKENVTGFSDDFVELLENLNHRTLQSVQKEKRNINRRNLILDFPRQIALAKSVVMDFIGHTFSDAYQKSPLLLRGVYLTSGTQKGTPIDRIMGILSKKLMPLVEKWQKSRTNQLFNFEH
ncbi:type VI secretion system membrane subunit TssM [Desulfobacterales bacterium HSG16]|nr:type VI secretion system membrane subunit TssM [Desulfobacterales bacterium HSG16]